MVAHAVKNTLRVESRLPRLFDCDSEFISSSVQWNADSKD